jgi:hypothetical protein
MYHTPRFPATIMRERTPTPPARLVQRVALGDAPEVEGDARSGEPDRPRTRVQGDGGGVHEAPGARGGTGEAVLRHERRDRRVERAARRAPDGQRLIDERERLGVLRRFAGRSKIARARREHELEAGPHGRGGQPEWFVAQSFLTFWRRAA